MAFDRTHDGRSSIQAAIPHCFSTPMCACSSQRLELPVLILLPSTHSHTHSPPSFPRTRTPHRTSGLQRVGEQGAHHSTPRHTSGASRGPLPKASKQHHRTSQTCGNPPPARSTRQATRRTIVGTRPAATAVTRMVWGEVVQGIRASKCRFAGGRGGC